MRGKGIFGRIEVREDAVVILRTGIIPSILGMTRERIIPFDAIKEIGFQKANLFMNGYIEFLFKVDVDSKSIFNEDVVYFILPHEKTFEQLKNTIEHHMLKTDEYMTKGKIEKTSKTEAMPSTPTKKSASKKKTVKAPVKKKTGSETTTKKKSAKKAVKKTASKKTTMQAAKKKSSTKAGTKKKAAPKKKTTSKKAVKKTQKKSTTPKKKTTKKKTSTPKKAAKKKAK